MKPDAIANVNAFGVHLFFNRQLSRRDNRADGPDLVGAANQAARAGLRCQWMSTTVPEPPNGDIHSRSGGASLPFQSSGLAGKRSYVARLFGLLLVFCLVFAAACSRSEANQYDPGEANVLVAAAYAAKDGECGTTHTFSSILFFPADRENVQLCVVAILESNCTAWSVADPTPDSCKFIGVQFES